MAKVVSKVATNYGVMTVRFHALDRPMVDVTGFRPTPIGLMLDQSRDAGPSYVDESIRHTLEVKTFALGRGRGAVRAALDEDELVLYVNRNDLTSGEATEILEAMIGAF